MRTTSTIMMTIRMEVGVYNQSTFFITGEQRWHRLLHWHALHHAPPRLHLHHRLQLGDDEAHGRSHDGPLPGLRHHLSRPL